MLLFFHIHSFFMPTMQSRDISNTKLVFLDLSDFFFSLYCSNSMSFPDHLSAWFSIKEIPKQIFVNVFSVV